MKTAPNGAFTRSAHRRATASLTPPGTNGTTSLIGRSGYLAWARARGITAPAHSAAAPRVRTSRRFIGEFLASASSCFRFADCAIPAASARWRARVDGRTGADLTPWIEQDGTDRFGVDP